MLLASACQGEPSHFPLSRRPASKPKALTTRMSSSYNLKCPIARTLDIIGERWTILILRDLFCDGPRKFQDFEQSLSGASATTLSARLKKLEDNAIVARRFYSNHPPQGRSLRQAQGCPRRDVGPAPGTRARVTGERPLTAFLDANALYPAELRNLLMPLALAEAYRPLWSDRVQKEWTEALARDRPDLPREKIERVRALMEQHMSAAQQHVALSCQPARLPQLARPRAAHA